MKNTIITFVFIGSLIFSGVNALACGNESKKKIKNNKETIAELLKFSINDYVGMEDACEDLTMLDLLKTETRERDTTLNSGLSISILNEQAIR